MPLGLQVTRTSFLVVEHLDVDMLQGTALINRNIESMYKKCGAVVSTGLCPVALDTLSDATLQANTF